MPLSEKKKASNAKWDSMNLKRISLALPVSLYQKMKDHIGSTRETMNGFIKRAIQETIETEKKGSE